ncbi:MAG TPA: hypothetical protein VLA09_04945, partial [Longimicrobiales bacterium]|nr:hypothetical protein [Longimicrobiales bacterium]
GAFAEAVDQLRAALEVTGHARAGVTIRLNLAEALLAQGRGLEAAEHAREAEREAIQARLVSKLPEVYRLLGRIASTEGISDAFVFFERALQLGRERGLPRLEEALTLQAYAEAEAARGEAEAATELAALAGRLFETLGMEHGRSRWADVYGSGTRAPAPPTDRDDEDHDS